MIVGSCYTVNTGEYEGILKVTFKDDYDFTLPDAQELFADLKKICQDKPKPVLKIPGKYSSIDNDARKFIASNEGMKYSSAEALVTSYLPQKIIGNFYLAVNKPVKPTSFFDSEEKAVAWLKQFIFP